MSEGGYKIRNQAEAHFITFTVVEWVDVFTRKGSCGTMVASALNKKSIRNSNE